MSTTTIPFPLIADIAKGRCLPFVGAGFSKNASIPDGLKMPDWKELAAQLGAHAGAVPSAEPPLIAQGYQDKFGRVQLVEAIREALHPDKARPGAAHRAFASLPFDTVYTTNFDLLLEDAYNELGRPFRSLVGELQMPFHAGQTASSIVKMHGDLRHEEHIVVTQDDYDSFLAKYPVIATHLSAMLITRTPLFVGYSLSDPDFASIRQVVRARLGDFERMAYVVQFDVGTAEVEKALKEKVHIISLTMEGAQSRDRALATFFAEILLQLDTRSGVTLRNSRPDVFESAASEIVKKAADPSTGAAIAEATSKLCFVVMPFNSRGDEVYRKLIVPTAADSGLTAVRADELSMPGFIIEQIRSAIQQSRLCIADVTGFNPNVMYEVGLIHAMKKPLVLLAEKGSQLPFDVAHQRVIFYESELSNAQPHLLRALNEALGGRLARAFDLLNTGHFAASIVTAWTAFEQRLRCLALANGVDSNRLPPRRMLLEMQKKAFVPVELYARFDRLIDIRNRSVHAIDDWEPTREDAEFVLNTVTETLDVTANEVCP